MVSITPTGHDLVRLDGWLAPAGRHAVELRTPGQRLTTTADADGRFVLDDVPHGLAQVIVRPAGLPHRPRQSVVTPAIVV
jgi:hypothetical protein